MAREAGDREGEMVAARRTLPSGSCDARRSRQVNMGSTDIQKMRGLFGLPKEEKMMGVYQCSVRREVNAQKEDQPNVGELYIFEVRRVLGRLRRAGERAPRARGRPPVAAE